jgi:hypothetical protein
LKVAVLVRKEPERRYQKVGAIGTSQSEREQADRLDARLEKRVARLVKTLNDKGIMPKQQGKGSLLTYWELGRALREVAESSDFPHKAELPLLWRNAKMYLPKEVLYKQRGPYREHLWYCYRLGSYPRKLAQKMKWGEWVTIFDSSGINQESRFDHWFQQKLSNQKDRIDRAQIRMFAPCVNKLLGDIDVNDLSESELFNCYEAAWQISSSWHAKKTSDPRYAVKREDIQKHIESKFALLDKVMDGSVSPNDFASEILGFPK